MRKHFLTFTAAFMLCFGTLKSQTHATDVTITGSQCIGIDCPTNPTYGFDSQRFVENNLRIHFDDTSASAGFAANDWRITINDSDNGGANYFSIDDATAGRSIFKLSAGAPANSFFMSSAGNIGIGTASPLVEMHIANGDTPIIRLEQDGTSGFTPQTWDVAGNETNFFIRDATNSSALPFRIRAGAGTDDAIVIQADGTVTIGTDVDQTQKFYVNGDAAINGDIYVLSDRRIKKNIEDSDYGLKEVMQLSAKKYQYDAGNFKNLNLPTNDQIGLIAQEVEVIVPEAISKEHSIVELNGEKIALKGVNYIKLVPVLIQAVQEQQAKLDVKNEEITQLRTELDLLKEQVSLITSHLQEEGMSAEAEHNHNHAENTTPQISNQDDENAPVIESAAKLEAQKPIIKLNNGRND
ncbi:MAG: hypothetical protein ACI94Y_000037 [Maribacter sp.]|jgi:hypothetical protein